MKSEMNDADLAKLIGGLPYYTLPADFNRRVMAQLVAAVQPARPAAWLVWAEGVAGTVAACWLGAAVFTALFLAVSYMDSILPLLAEPRALLSGLKFYALKAGFFAMELLRYLSLGKAVLVDKAGGLYLLPRLALATLLAGAVIFALSGRRAYADRGAIIRR